MVDLCHRAVVSCPNKAQLASLTESIMHLLHVQIIQQCEDKLKSTDFNILVYWWCLKYKQGKHGA